ncbi:MAG TPA: PQQ-binding-like beta-propeller repeat protein [Verrucomicrobiae bacterium]|nr:PQQ-binding-like beta-propeller repeat protein [Verrucomicrobiae bacterium]
MSRIAIIATTFCTLVGGYMLYQHAKAAERDPWKSPQLLALKEKLRASPTDETVKAEIRRLDLEFRQRYQRRLALDATGGWLLVGGVAVLVLAARPSVKWRTPQWLPKLRPDAATAARRLSTQARLSVVATGAIVGAGLLTLALAATSPLPKSAAELDMLLGKSSDSEASASLPALAEFELNWPQFRGMNGGTATNELGFDAKSASVIWKAPIPAPGFNSPVVWSNRVFISGGDAAKREVFCFDTTDGTLLWRRAIENVPGSSSTPPEIPDATGWAAPTMATDGRHAFAMFVNGDLVAVNFDGSVAWAKHLGVPKNMYGHASSLAIAPGNLIVQLDQDEEAPGSSKLMAFDCATGRKFWERTKPTHGSWSSPIIVTVSGKSQIISLALPFVMSHALADGNELWRAEVMDGEITPSPIVANGLIVAVNPNGGLLALRPDGAGDVTQTHVAWRAEENVPDVTSPVSNGALVFTVTSSGSVAGFDLKDGKQVWQQELGLEVQSSPAIAGKQLFVLSTKGDLISLEAAREFKKLGRAKLEDTFHASPAFADGRMILRGATNLWCLGKAK